MLRSVSRDKDRETSGKVGYEILQNPVLIQECPWQDGEMKANAIHRHVPKHLHCVKTRIPGENVFC